jgi:hypothetical protein
MNVVEINIFDEQDIRYDIYEIERILATGILSEENNNPFRQAAFVDVLIHLRDLMFKAEKYAGRISFTDDVIVMTKVKDISDLIKFVRDAMCHPEIEHHFVVPNRIKATFETVYGKGGRVLDLVSPDIPELSTSDYSDDVCFFFGLQRIYLNRHIIKAFEEAKQKLLPLMSY